MVRRAPTYREPVINKRQATNTNDTQQQNNMDPRASPESSDGTSPTSQARRSTDNNTVYDHPRGVYSAVRIVRTEQTTVRFEKDLVLRKKPKRNFKKLLSPTSSMSTSSTSTSPSPPTTSESTDAENISIGTSECSENLRLIVPLESDPNSSNGSPPTVEPPAAAQQTSVLVAQQQQNFCPPASGPSTSTGQSTSGAEPNLVNSDLPNEALYDAALQGPSTSTGQSTSGAEPNLVNSDLPNEALYDAALQVTNVSSSSRESEEEQPSSMDGSGVSNKRKQPGRSNDDNKRRKVDGGSMTSPGTSGLNHRSDQLMRLLNQNNKILDQNSQILDRDRQIFEQNAKMFEQNAKIMDDISKEQKISAILEKIPPETWSTEEGRVFIQSLLSNV